MARSAHDWAELCRGPTGIWSSHDADRVAALFDHDATYRDAHLGVARGRDQVRRLYLDWQHALPDHTYRVVSALSDGDRIAVEWEGNGTVRALLALPNLPAPGRRARLAGVDIVTVKDDLLVEVTSYFDLLG